MYFLLNMVIFQPVTLVFSGVYVILRLHQLKMVIFSPGKEMDPTDLTKQLVLDGTSIRAMAGGVKNTARTCLVLIIFLSKWVICIDL